jgi:hypothetical protein
MTMRRDDEIDELLQDDPGRARCKTCGRWREPISAGTGDDGRFQSCRNGGNPSTIYVMDLPS